MHLSKLEMKGFKSFAQRSEMNFNKGITAVVGPNGCGKSNVADAIRWVLGEQSARSLRGHKMEDIIFSGTDRKKPQGLAEVTIVFDNKSGELPVPYHEVAITRRVFRSGESEYLLNNTRCRLKDVKELLMDTGIGKEGYSIIGQGRIDELLSQKGEERRFLFDEAAGIVKFRTRKEEAEKKMVKTEENLCRLNDIILELKGQIDPLRIQAEKAERYLNLREKVTFLEVDCLIKDYDKYTSQRSVLEDEQINLRETIELILVELNKLESEKHKIESDVEGFLAEQEVLVNKIQGIKKSQEEQRTVYLLNCQKLEHLIEQKERLTLNHTEAEHDQEKEAIKLAELSRKHENQKAQLDEMNHMLQQLNNNIHTTTLRLDERQQQLENNKAGIVETLNEISGFKAKRERLWAMSESAEERNRQLNNEMTRLNEDLAHVSNQYDSEMKEALKVGSQVKSLVRDIESDETTISSVQEHLSAVELDLYQISKDHDQAVHRKNMLVNMEKSFEGFQRGVKNVLRAVQQNSELASGFHGVVADLIRVPNGYEIAVETALGAALQHLVTDDEQQAKRIIEYLKHQHLGRVTILPLTIIKGRMLRHNELRILEKYPTASCAIDLISFPSPYQSIFESLLGRVIVADDLETAISIARDFNHQIKITTVEGELLQPGGSMTGGTSTKLPEGLLVRKREIEELGKEIHELAAKKKDKEKIKLELDTKRKESNQLLQEKKRLLTNLQEQNVRLESTCLNLKNQMSEKEYRFQLLQDEKDQLSDHLKQLSDDIGKLENSLKEKEETLINVQRNMDLELNEQQVIKNEISDLTKRLNTHQIEMAEMTEKEKAILSEISLVEQLHDSVIDRVRTIDEETRVVLSKKEHVLKCIEDDKKKEKTIELEINNATQNHDKIKQLIQTCQQALKHHMTDRDNVAKRNEETKETIHQYEIKVSKIEWQVQQLLDKLREQHAFNLTQARIWLKNNHMNNVKMSDLTRLKSEMDALGDVHIGALEEFKRVQDRYEFLLQQQKDLLDSKESLINIISDLEDHMKRQFEEQFHKIQDKFNEVFQRLFHGGSTQLILQNPNDLLSTGIDIIAQPPGKKSQHLSLLSGGEKALTAISLLFGILLVKPSPFCVLDEIEAALDDANVSRFADYLISLSEGIQFIVVTHKKQTMERADTLYGITMQEKGISKLLTLKLQEIDQNMIAG